MSRQYEQPTSGDTAGQPFLALAWLKGSISRSERIRIRKSIKAKAGVVSLETSARSKHLFLIRFDRDGICAARIVGWLNSSGISAVLVSCADSGPGPSDPDKPSRPVTRPLAAGNPIFGV